MATIYQFPCLKRPTKAMFYMEYSIGLLPTRRIPLAACNMTDAMQEADKIASSKRILCYSVTNRQ